MKVRMFPKRRYLLGGAVASAAWIALAQAGDFAPPAEGPVAFRRDRIPLDADAMAGLSKNLETLARGLNAATADDRRGAAQMLALSLALDPANAKAREVINEYASGFRKPDADPVQLEKSRARIWQLIGWLESPEAGSQGQALGACLKDVIIISDPGNPKAAAIKQSGEKGAWAAWVPARSAYDTAEVASNNTPDSTTPPPTENPTDSSSPLKLTKAEASTLLWKSIEKSENPVWKLALGQVEMSAEPSDGGDSGNGGKQFALHIGGHSENNPLNQIAGSLRGLLRKRHAEKCNGVSITIGGQDLESSIQANRRLAISAAAAVLADSAFTGAEPDAVILGSVDENGAYKLPSGFWDQIRALPKGTGRRLLLPADAAAFMPSMLALEHPEFFLEYQVILATDFDQLCALAAKTPAGPAGSALTEFRTVQDRLGSQDPRQYIANSYVRQRFHTVLQDLPSHLSAKLLLIQAAGNRPTTVSRPILASEIRRAMEPLAPIVKLQDYEFKTADIARIAPTYDACRAGVDALDRYAAKNDAPLLLEAREVLNFLRTLEKATRTRGEDYVVKNAVNTARGDLARSAKLFADKLNAEIGDPAPQPSR